MSITTENNRTAELTTDGVETEFDFSLLIHDESEIQVWYEVSGGSYTQLVLDTNYTVIFTEAGGTVTTIGGSSPYAAGKILIIRNIALTQQTNWLYNDNHSEQQHQDDFDRSVMRDLQIQEQLDRCVKFDITSDTTGIDFPEPSSDKMIGWNTAATALENKTPESAFVIGITDGDILQVDGTPNSGEYARFTADGLEGRTVAELGADGLLLANGTIALAGNWSLSAFNLTSVGNITGTDVDISAGTGNYTSTGTVKTKRLLAGGVTE